MYSGRGYEEEMGMRGVGLIHGKCNNEGSPKLLTSEFFNCTNAANPASNLSNQAPAACQQSAAFCRRRGAREQTVPVGRREED
jgi:hypothetical protein